jgi:putative FmdB family regulatory protein
MPIYEFYCKECHMIFNFFSKSINTRKRPMCPRCEKVELDRQMSIFSTPKYDGDDEGLPWPDIDESKMEKAMGLLEREMADMDDEDPRQTANLMRKLSDMTGLDLGPGMEEALQRMESGEDPETIEADMGDVLESDDLFTLRKNLARESKKRPPRVDETLYDL